VRDLIDSFINDLKVEAVKLQLQLSSPASTRQDNDVLGSLLDGEVDAGSAMGVIRDAMHGLREADSVADLQALFEEWNKNRIEIQYDGYGYTENSRTTRKGEAYAYVFLMRVLKKRHADLYGYMKMTPVN
jgi:hypothetical protein